MRRTSFLRSHAIAGRGGVFITCAFALWCAFTSLVWGEELQPGARVIKITATADGRFEPSSIAIRVGEEVVFEVIAYRDADSRHTTWPPDVLHGFMIRLDQMVLIEQPLKEEITWIPWSTLIPSKLTLSCWLHKGMQAIILVGK